MGKDNLYEWIFLMITLVLGVLGHWGNKRKKQNPPSQVIVKETKELDGEDLAAEGDNSEIEINIKEEASRRDYENFLVSKPETLLFEEYEFGDPTREGERIFHESDLREPSGQEIKKSSGKKFNLKRAIVYSELLNTKYF